MNWVNVLYLGIGAWIGKSMNTLSRLYQTFQGQECVNTVLPKKIEQYIPKKVINTIEMSKFIFEHVWIQLEQFLTRSCVKKDRFYHVRFVIDNKPYSLIIKPERGPESHYILTDEHGIDRSEIVKSYMRGIQSVSKKLTPRDLGYSTITKFLENEKICSYDSTDLLT
jgi:hypothetical protein